MKHLLVRYKTKPDSTAENRRLIETVFEALKARSPKDFNYKVVELEDGSFVHFKSSREGGFELHDLPAFQAFRGDIAERCDEPPKASGVRIVGEYAG
jgi:hypothetical protein